MDPDTRPHVSIFTLPGEAPVRGETTRPSDAVLPLPGAGQEPGRIGGYRIVRELGRGGMGSSTSVGPDRHVVECGEENDEAR